MLNLICPMIRAAAWAITRCPFCARTPRVTRPIGVVVSLYTPDNVMVAGCTYTARRRAPAARMSDEIGHAAGVRSGQIVPTLLFSPLPQTGTTFDLIAVHRLVLSHGVPLFHRLPSICCLPSMPTKRSNPDAIANWLISQPMPIFALSKVEANYLKNRKPVT